MSSFIGPLIMVLVLVFGAVFLLFWNKKRVKGKVLGFFLSGEVMLKPELCPCEESFVFYKGRAYDFYPSRVRFVGFPTGFPSILQERIPALLYDVENGVPLDWKDPPIQSDARLRSMNIKSALMENMLRKMVEEASRETGVTGSRINWKKILPIIMVIGGIIGFIFIMQRSGGIGGLFGG